MLKIFGETYHIDFDKIENLISIKQTDTGDTEQNVSIVKFELIKTMLDVVLSEVGDIDEKMGLKGSNDLILDSTGDLILETTPASLFKKAVITPKGYLNYEYDIDQFIDTNYGNDVYFKIGENLNNSILSDLTQDVKEAVSFVNIPTTSIEASISSLLQINYLIKYQEDTTQEIIINV